MGLSSTDTLTGLSIGDKVNITITAPDGKEVDAFKVDDTTVDLEGATTYELTVSGDHNVTCTYKDIV